MNNLKTLKPEEVNGKSIQIVCDGKIVFEDIICSIGKPAYNTTQLNLATGQITFEDNTVINK